MSHSYDSFFHTLEDFEHAPPLSFAIKPIIQNGGITLLGGLSGHGKTLIMLDWVRSLLSEKSDKKLWGHFKVEDVSKRVIYLTPEVGITPFKHRLKPFKLMHHIRTRRLLVHTLTKGPTPDLQDKQLLRAARGADIFIDPAIRFGSGNENEARENQKLANDLFELQRAGATSIVISQHSPKSFEYQTYMSLETVLRGSGDIGAMAAVAWGIKQLDARQNIIHVECVKARDFEPPEPFQIIGRPSIKEEGHFLMHKAPGLCGILSNELNGGGASMEQRVFKNQKLELMREWLKKSPGLSNPELLKRYKKQGIKIEPPTIRKYRHLLKGKR